jgi:hypothetical protein
LPFPTTQWPQMPCEIAFVHQLWNFSCKMRTTWCLRWEDIYIYIYICIYRQLPVHMPLLDKDSWCWSDFEVKPRLLWYLTKQYTPTGLNIYLDNKNKIK